MFEGIVSNYPKRMDIWSIYTDMEVKYGAGLDPSDKGSNVTQARHLFERCLNLEDIQKKLKKMKLVFRKYMEFEHGLGNQKRVVALKERVEEYLAKTFPQEKASSASEASGESGSDAESGSGSGSGSEESDDDSESDEEQ